MLALVVFLSLFCLFQLKAVPAGNYKQKLVKCVERVGRHSLRLLLRLLYLKSFQLLSLVPWP